MLELLRNGVLRCSSWPNCCSGFFFCAKENAEWGPCGLAHGSGSRKRSLGWLSLLSGRIFISLFLFSRYSDSSCSSSKIAISYIYGTSPTVMRLVAIWTDTLLAIRIFFLPAPFMLGPLILRTQKLEE